MKFFDKRKGAPGLLSVAALFAAIAIPATVSAQTNLLEGAMEAVKDGVKQTPYQVGWRFNGCSESDFTTSNGPDDAGTYFRTGQNLAGNDGYDNATVLYLKNADVKYAYPISPEPGKVYELQGQVWRRNGGDTNINYSFYFADNLAGDNPFCKAEFNYNRNNKVIKLDDYKLRFAVTETTENCYFLWSATTSNWQRGGFLDNVKLVEIGNVAVISFDAGEGEGPAPIAFVEGEEYTVQQAPLARRIGYNFIGWYSDADLTQAVTFPLTVTANTTLYAKWERKGLNGNLMEGWDGNGRGTAGDIPSMFGWVSTPECEWHEAYNSGDYWNGYRDNISVDGVQTRTLFLVQRNYVYSYPVAGLKKDKIYRFSADFSYMNHGATHTFAINSSRDGNGTEYASVKKATAKWGAWTSAEMYFEVPEDIEEAYMCWSADETKDRALSWNYKIEVDSTAHRVVFVDGDSILSKSYFADGEQYTVTVPQSPVKEGYDFVGWYADAELTKAFDFAVPVETDVTVYARFLEEGATGELSPMEISADLTIPALVLADAKVTGNAKVHLTGARPFIGGSKIDLEGSANHLFLENVKPSAVLDTYKDVITIKGQPIDPEHDRVAIYASGSLILPGGWDVTPLTLYNQPALKGDSFDCAQDIFYRGELSTNDLGKSEQLGENFDNNIRSFRLAYGYMCVIANNPDGTGFSRCYIANDGDLEVNEMPEGLEFASFVRVCRWQWVSKKGTANLDCHLTDGTWYYDWNSGGNNMDTDFEYAMIRQNLGWPGWNDIAGKTNVSHCSGLNEPDHTDQSNATPEEAIEQWHEMFRTGLRLGSPTPDSFNKAWLNTFMQYAEELNYRVDYVVYHMYWDGQTGNSLKNQIKNNSERFGYRPVWITEWNNGANWTNENWPTNQGPKRDADFNVILDDNGNETIITRPHSPENSAKQIAWLKDVLPALDESPYLERHAWYDWVQDARALVLGGKLTPAGKVFRDHKAKLAYRSENEYVHTWKIAPAWLTHEISEDFKAINIKWYDHNGETGKNYTLERKLNDGEWLAVDTLVAGTDYVYGGTVVFTDSIMADKQVYRVKALSYKDTESAYSRECKFVRDNAPAAPEVTAKAISSTIINLEWNEVSGARGYKIERALAPGAADVEPEFEVLAENMAETKFTDKGLEVATAYIYRVSSLSTAADVNSTAVTVSTLTLVAPDAIEDAFAAGGDAKVTITWKYAYDAIHRIFRQDSDEGLFLFCGEVPDGDRFVDYDVENGNIYRYIIETHNAAGSAESSQVLEARPDEGQHLMLMFDAENTLKDSWGGYHATVAGNLELVEGRDANRKAIKLSSADKSHIVLPEGVVSELTGDFTIAMWVKIGNNSRIFDFNSGTGTFMMFMPTSNTQMRYKITCGAGTFDYRFDHAAMNRSEWNHLTLVSEGNDMHLYINSQLASSTRDAQGEVGDVVAPAKMGVTTTNYLGRSAWSSDPYSDHSFDEFTIYNRALNDNEIKSVYNGDYMLSAVDGVSDDVTVRVSGRNVVVTVPSERTVNVFAVDGRLVRSFKAAEGANVIEGLSSGFYLIEGHKVVL
ncbi:MAG: InlB B-repeat-containing protein [Muribaculaceae bacterium]